MKFDLKNPIVLLAAIAILLVVLHESRFLLFSPFGEPAMLPIPNCGESRYDFNVKINSKQEFLTWAEEVTKNYSRDEYIEWLKKREKGGNIIPQHPYGLMQVFVSPLEMGEKLNKQAVTMRDNGSIIFPQKIYSIKPVSYCPEYFFEITSNGYARLKGCCGE